MEAALQDHKKRREHRRRDLGEPQRDESSDHNYCIGLGSTMLGCLLCCVHVQRKQSGQRLPTCVMLRF